jgi:hypothetical protein
MARPYLAILHVFPHHFEVRLMAQQCQQQQVSVLAIHHVPRVGIVARLGPQMPHKLHHLVLAFTWF